MAETKNPLIYSKIAEVMQNLKAVSKDRQTSGYASFKFRGIDDVMNTLHNVLADAGVFIVPEVLKEEREERKGAKGNILLYTRLTIRFTFYAADGSNIQSVVIGEAMDSGDKASNKALSIGYKYACLQVFCIPTEDDKDPDAITHQVADNGPNIAPQAPAANNRVNYPTRPNNAPQYNAPQQQGGNYQQPAPTLNTMAQSGQIQKGFAPQQQTFDTMQQAAPAAPKSVPLPPVPPAPAAPAEKDAIF